MAKESPEATDTSTTVPAVQSSRLPIQPTTVSPITPAMQKALIDRGYELPEVRTRQVPYHFKISWEDLCVMSTQDPKTMSSPLLAIVQVDAFPEAPQEFEDYIGFTRFEFYDENGAAWAATHAYAYAATGELTPLTAWLQETPPPFLARIGYVETRKVGRHVVRPLPIDIEVS